MTSQPSDETDAETDAIGYLYTEWDCPNCSETCRVEGDASGDEVTCDLCHHTIKITEVR